MQINATFLSAPGLFLCLMLSTLGAAEKSEVLFEDKFEYASWNSDAPAVADRWERVLGSSLEVVTKDQDQKLPTPYIKFNNLILSTELKTPPKGDFTVSAQVLFTDFARCLWFGLLPEDGTSGVIAVWSSALADQFGGQGYLWLRQIDRDMLQEDRAAVTPVDFSTALFHEIPSGHMAVYAPDEDQPAEFITIHLSHKASSGTWELYVNDNFRGSADVSLPDKPVRLFIAGGNAALFKNIEVRTGTYVP